MVTPDVLIPRPETELLVEAALDLLRDTPSPGSSTWAPAPAASRISLAAERRDAEVNGHRRLRGRAGGRRGERGAPGRERAVRTSATC